MNTTAILLAVAVMAACSESRDRVLPVPLPLSFQDGVLRGFGGAVGSAEGACDETERPARLGPTLLDVGTPLSVFRSESAEPPLRYDRGRVFFAGDQRGAAGAVRMLLCDAPILRTDQPAELFRLRFGAAALPVSMVLGGDLLRRFALSFAFALEPDEPLCQSPPCLRVSRSDLATACRLADRGDAVFPFTPIGGELLVKIGDNVISLPPTRATIAACLEPAPDPLAGAEPAPCLSCAKLDERRRQLSAEPERYRCRLAQLDDLYGLICNPTPERACPVGGRLPGALPSPMLPPPAQCPEALSLEDLVLTEGLVDPRYQVSGTPVRLLISTALPGLLLSRTAFVNLRGEAAAAALFKGAAVPLQMPGFPVENAYPVTDLSALALLSQELHLSPCDELARSRRQRFGLPRRTAAGCAQRCDQSACLVNLNRDSTQVARRCGYGGENAERACDDLQAPVAAAIELDGPIKGVLVAEDTTPILRAVNDELRNSAAQVDGILGVALLARLRAEIDYPGQRLLAHCRCGERGCRAYRRFTYKAADDCAEAQDLCLPDAGGKAPGAIAPLSCRL